MSFGRYIVGRYAAFCSTDWHRLPAPSCTCTLAFGLRPRMKSFSQFMVAMGGLRDGDEIDIYGGMRRVKGKQFFVRHVGHGV